MAAEPGRSRASRVRAALPVVAVKDRGEMGVMLAKQGRLLREYAREYLGEGATEDEVESAIERTVDVLLEPESVSHRHALRHATQQLWHECRRALQERGNPVDVPVDRRVGPINEQARRILAKLGPLSREAILRAAQGWTLEQQARADHTSVGTINMRLHRGRQRFKQLKAKMEASASAVGGFFLTRARRVGVRVGQRVSAAVVHGTISPPIAAAFVPLVAITLWSGGGGLHQPSASRPTVAPSVLQTAPAGGFAPVGPHDKGVAKSPTPATATVTTTRAAVTAPVLPVRGLVQRVEERGDLQLTAVATLPGVDSRVIVAIGEGSSCRCRRLVQSLDGGATWTATSGPPATLTQLALPPDYPADPRIFGGVDPLGGGAPYEAAAFGQPFRQLAGLPPGHVATSAHFDDGDPRLFAAGVTGVWSINPERAHVGGAHEEIDYAAGYALQSTVATLATPPATAQGPALLVWSPAGSTVPGTPSEPALNAPVVACPVRGLCATESFLGAPPGGLAVAGSSVLAYNGNLAFLSADDGHSFHELLVPARSKAISSMTFVGASDQIWLSTTISDASAAVYRLTASGWQDESSGNNVVTARGGALVAAGTDDVIDVLPDAGYRCTSAETIEWLPRCPA